jgi:hypothetical protein
MAREDHIPRVDEGKAVLFERFRITVPAYAGAMGLSNNR